MRKRFFLIAGISILLTDVFSQTTQTYNLDSLIQVLGTNLHDTNRIWALNNLARNLPNSDSTVTLSEQAIALSKKIGFTKGEAEGYNNIAYWFNRTGNYPKALEHYLKSIQLSESVNFEAGLKRSYNSIATVYLYMKDYANATNYSRKARSLSIKLNDLATLALASSWLSKAYLDLHQLDSALKYGQESYGVASKLKEPFPLYLATARLGEISAAEKNHNLALEYFRLSLHFSKQDKRYFRIAGAHQQLAIAFRDTGAKDSCLWHAKQAFDISSSENLPATLLSSGLLLSELYEGIDDSESLRYHKFAMTAQDSLFGQEKNRQVQALTFAETMRQREIEAAMLAAAEERKINLQYAAIALTTVLFVILFLLFSHSVMANEKLIRFLGVLALLIVFEFINLLLHPVLGSLTHHSPVLMLFFMVCVAALLIPVHHRLEKLIIHKLVEKNKTIRLAAAKKLMAATQDGPEGNAIYKKTGDHGK